MWSVPPELGKLANLKLVNLAANALTGPIPPELGKLSKLELLYLDSNELTGSIRPELGSLALLRHLDLGGNTLDGSIPPELGNLASLVFLRFDGNNLSGPIPPEFANLVRLRVLSVLGNVGLCAPDDPRLLAWLAERRVSVLPCQRPRERLLPRALIREDGNGLSLALPDDLRDPLAVRVSDPSVVAASVAEGWLELVPRGRGSAEVEIVPSGSGSPAIAGVTVRAAIGTFGIDIVMQEPAPSGYAETFVTIADWWSSVLDGTEWPDRSTTFRVRELAEIRAMPDELLIYAGTDLDADRAGPGYARVYPPVSGLPIGGEVWARLGAGTGLGLINHEIGHLLGLVRIWPRHLVTETVSGRYFVGPRAVQAFRAGGGDSNLPGVPMDGSHWKKAHVSDFMGGGRGVVISFSALQDAGYTVDLTKWPFWW